MAANNGGKRQILLYHEQIIHDVLRLAHLPNMITLFGTAPKKAYPVPRGGVPVAYLLRGALPLIIVDDVETADLIVDDIIDTGRTRDRFPEQIPFVAPYRKPVGEPKKGNWYAPVPVPEDCWIVFPWEVGDVH